MSRPGWSGNRRIARRLIRAHEVAPAAKRTGRMREVVIHVCVTCRREGDDPDAPRAGARLHDALAAALPERVTLLGVECLGNCKRSCSIAMRADGTWSYVFGDLTPESDGDVLVAAGLLAASADGLMPWRGRPDAFKRGMVARIPPVPDLKDAAE
jgi:predicted metal-binding protein